MHSALLFVSQNISTFIEMSQASNKFTQKKDLNSNPFGVKKQVS